MSLRTSRWILRVLLLPFLLPYFVVPASIFSYYFSTPFPRTLSFEALFSLIMVAAIGAAIPGIPIYAIWKGHRDSERIINRRHRRHQINWDQPWSDET